jgi:hypothetical protein
MHLNLPDEPGLEPILHAVAEELARQRRKWGRQDHDDGRWSLIAQEEAGEAAKAALEDDPKALRAELIETAAVYISWAAALERRERE